MNRIEFGFFIAVLLILLAYVCMMPEFSLIYAFLLFLAIIILIGTFMLKNKEKYENEMLYNIFCILTIVLFIIYFANAVYIDFTHNSPIVSNMTIFIVFMITVILGWFFKKEE